MVGLRSKFRSLNTMKKGKHLLISLLAATVLIGAGCSKTQTSTTQEQSQTKVSIVDDSRKLIPRDQVVFKNESGYSVGEDIVVFLYNKQKDKKFRFSFKGDITKLQIPEERDLMGRKNDFDYTTFNYDGITVALDPNLPGGFMQDTFAGVSYVCDGALYKTKGYDRPNFFCKTNGENYLEQFEIFVSGPSAGDASLGVFWNKLYMKKFSGNDIFFFTLFISGEDVARLLDLAFDGNFAALPSSKSDDSFLSQEALTKILRDNSVAEHISSADNFVKNIKIDVVQ